MRYMAERCGAWQVGDDPTGGEVEFRIFIPAALIPISRRSAWPAASRAGISLATFHLPANHTPKGRCGTPDGPAECQVGFHEYKYAVDFDHGATRIVSDPCTLY
jgi:pullulanase